MRNLDRLDQELVELESTPSSKKLLGSVFRTIHTIKGGGGFLGFTRFEKVTHAGENLLCRLRDGKLTLTGEGTSGLFAMVDAVRQMLAAIKATGADGKGDYVRLIYGERMLAVVLAGMGQDGLRGCEMLRTAGARIYVQDEATSVVWGMPGFVARARLADKTLPLDQIAGEIVRATTLSVALVRNPDCSLKAHTRSDLVRLSR